MNTEQAAKQAGDSILAARVHELVRELNQALRACALAGLLTDVREQARAENIGGQPYQVFGAKVSRLL